MQRTLRFLGLVAVIGAFAIVTAQNSVRSKTGPNQLPGGVMASPQNGGYSNNVLMLAAMYFTHRHQTAIDRAEAMGRGDRVGPIVQANCAAALWLQTSKQQAATVAHWEIEKYQGRGSKWDEIARTPSLVKSLLSVSKQTDAKVNGFIDEVWAPIMNLNKDFEDHLVKTAAWKNATSQQERNILHYEGLKVWRQTHPVLSLEERRAATLARYEKAMADTEKLLTSAQRSEFRTLRTKFDNALRVAANGDRP